MNKKSQSIRRVDQPLFRYWHAFYRSFYSQRLYVDVVKRWRGFGLMYLFLVLMIACLPFASRIILEFDAYFEKQIAEPISMLPPLYIQNGEISLDKPTPYFIKNKQNQVVLIVDTALHKIETINYLKHYPHLNVLMTKDRMYFRLTKPHFFFFKAPPTSDFKFYEQTFPKEDNEVFVGADVIKSSGVQRVVFLAKVLIYCLILMLFSAVFFVVLFTLSLLGQVFAQTLLDVKIKFKASCRLLAVAFTPTVVVFFTLLTMNALFQSIGLFLIGILWLYYCYGIIAVKRESKKMVFS